MHPDQLHSENIGRPWRPPVWDVGSESLFRSAQQQMHQDHADIWDALATDDRAMSGPKTAKANETEELIDRRKPATDDAPVRFLSLVEQLRDPAPRIPTWGSGDKTGDANPTGVGTPTTGGGAGGGGAPPGGAG